MQKETKEKWRKIPGYDGYLVSTLGRVKSLQKAQKHISRLKHELRSISACRESA